MLRNSSSNQAIVWAGVTSPCSITPVPPIATMPEIWSADALEVLAACGVCVVDPAVDCVTYDAFRMQSPAYGVGLHPNSNQIIAPEAVKSVLPADTHTLILRLRKKNLRVK